MKKISDQSNNIFETDINKITFLILENLILPLKIVEIWRKICILLVIYKK